MFASLVIPFTILLLVLVMGYYRLKLKPANSIRELIRQGAKFFVFQEAQSRKDTFEGFKALIRKNPDTKAIVLPLPGHVGLMFIDTELIKEVLANQKNYSKLNANVELSTILNARGITKAEGDDWKLHRKIVSEAFQYDLFNGMIPTMVECIQDVINFNDKSKRTIYLPDDIELITSDVVTRIFFGLKSRDVILNGKSASEEATEIIKHTNKFSNSILRIVLGNKIMNIYPTYRETKKRILNFRKTFGVKIQQRMQEIESAISHEAPERKDFLEILLRHRLKHNNDPSQTLSDSEILDEFSVFFMAGKDTTSLLVSLSLYLYVKNPEWAKKLQAEIDENIKDLKEINMDLLNSLNVMTAFVNEVLRMYPPAPALLRRIANRDHTVGNFTVKKGYIINTLFILNHYNPKYWKDPEEFNPGRWLVTENKDEGIKNPYAYLPFSAGQRNCVGKHLALIEAKLIISLILKHFNVSIREDFELRMGTHSIGYGPVKPIPLTLVRK